MGVPDDVVLFLLNRRHDVMHVLVVLLPQGHLKEFIPNRLVGIEHVGDFTVLNGELAFLNQLGVLGAGRRLVADLAEGAVIVDPGNWGPPVVDQEVSLVIVHQ